MDPTTTAVCTVTVLAALAKDAAKAFASEGGKLAFEKAKAILSAVRSALSSGAPADTLRAFEQNPEGYERPLQLALAERLKADLAFSATLEQLLAQLKSAGPSISVVLRLKKAELLTGADIEHMSRGTALIEIEADELRGGVGVRIGRIE
jgi:hypothetical protein